LLVKCAPAKDSREGTGAGMEEIGELVLLGEVGRRIFQVGS